MTRSKSALSLVFAAVLCACVGVPAAAFQSAPAAGPLRVHPTNPRYFADPSGKAVYLTGSHTWNNLQDGSWAKVDGLDYLGHPGAFNWPGYLDFLQSRNHNFVRLWTGENGSNLELGGTLTPPTPYVRVTGQGNALDGQPKFNVDQLNQAYFDRIRQRVIDARARGIYVSVMLFDSWGVGFYGGFERAWRGHWFNAANNINGINGDPNGDGKGLECHTLAIARLTEVQRAYVRKVVDTVNDLDNVLYEIANECGSTGGREWQYEMIRVLNLHQASKPRRHPVGMTATFDAARAWSTSADLYGSAADWIAPSGNEFPALRDNPPATTGAKVILLDTDHIWGVGGDRSWVWKSLTRGYSPIFMDPIHLGQPNSILAFWQSYAPGILTARAAMGHTRTYAAKMNLATMTPQNGLSSTTYCLASAGSEYLVYQAGTGAFTVNLAAATYAYEWFNPATGAVAGTGTITAAAGNRSFTAPFAGDAVLYLKATATSGSLVPPTIVSPANGMILASTTTQVTVSWNPVAGAAGYLVRCQDTGSGTMVVYQDRYTPTQIVVPVSAGRSYRFWVHSHTAAFSYGNPSSWSDESVVTFSVSASGGGPAIPTITAPSDGTVFPGTTTQVTVRWNAVPGAAGYLIRCIDTGTNVRVVYQDRYTPLQVNVPVSPGRSYLFWIHSHTADWAYGNPGTWSAEAQVRFSVSTGSPGGPPAIPTFTAPAAGQVFPTTTTAVTVSWNAVPGAAGYLIRALDLTTNTRIVYRDMYVGTSFTVPVVRGHSYRFWIHSAKSTFSYSDPTSFSDQANRYFSVAP